MALVSKQYESGAFEIDFDLLTDSLPAILALNRVLDYGII